MSEAPRELIIVGDADGIYRGLADRSPRLRVCAIVTADGLTAAVAEFAGAAVLVDALPRASGRATAALGGLGVQAVVVPPFLGAPVAPHVRVAPLLVGLDAAAWLRNGDAPLTLEVGCAEIGDDPHACWWHALAIASCFDPSLELRAFDPVAGSAAGRSFELTVHPRRRDTVARRPGGSYRVEGGQQHVEAGGRTRTRRIASYPERVLASLLAPTADTLALPEANRIEELVAELLPRRTGHRALRAASRARPRERFGLTLGSRAGDREVPPLEPLDIDPPLEQWPFAAGIKPVVFLTVEPGREAAVLAPFAGAHVERRERRVQVGDQDQWTDDRTRGAPRVELYISRDPTAARRAATLQTSGDPSGTFGELGELMGYPACCVAAFQRQAERGNNTLNRYLTASRTVGGAPWPWQLNELHHKLIPFYPCNYRCEAARAFADASLAALEAAHPGARDRLRATLSRTVLYLEHDAQLWFGATPAEHRRVGNGDPIRALAAALADATHIELTETALRAPPLAIGRTDPALGFLAPFEPDPQFLSSLSN